MLSGDDDSGRYRDADPADEFARNADGSPFDSEVYNAYTIPAGVGKRRPVRQAPPPSLQPRYGSVNTALVTLALAMVLCTMVFVFVFTNYDLTITRDEQGLRFALVSERTPQASAQLPDDVSTATLPPDNSSDWTPTGQQTGQSGYKWDGTTLEISDSEAPKELSYKQLFKKCSPSVVAITASTYSGSCSGSGIIMSEDGVIITNCHVVEGSVSVSVTLSDGAKYSAELIGLDKQTDLAVIKIDAEGLTAAEFGDSDLLEVGDEVAAIGNPLGQSLTLTNGLVSAINRNIKLNGYSMTLLQTNAAINGGSSGGPLINIYGQVIGITNIKIVSYYSTVEGMGFAIPMNVVKPIVDALLSQGYVSGRPSLGAELLDIPASAAAYYRMPRGVYVTATYSGADADGKLLEGDIITAADGEAVTDADSLNAVINRYSAGDGVELTVYRGGLYIGVTVTLADVSELNG